jgi:hypothetical protein
MDPASLILAAVAAGATAGITSVANASIQEAYAGLRAQVIRLLAGHGHALEQFEQRPETYRADLMEALTAAGPLPRDLVTAAKAVLDLADPDGVITHKFTVDLRYARGVQVGDHTTQHNTFS